MKRQTLTNRHRQVLDFVNKFIVEHGRSPTRREIAAGVGLGDGSLGHISRILIHTRNWSELDYLRARVRELEQQLEGRAAA